MSRKENDITDPSIKGLFEDKNIAFIATIMKDGAPQVTPTWVDIKDSNILINTALGRLKQKNISRDHRVAISIIDSNNVYHMVTLQGQVIEQVTGKDAEVHIDKMAKKYINKDRYPNRSPGEQRVLLKIKPEKIYQMK